MKRWTGIGLSLSAGLLAAVLVRTPEPAGAAQTAQTPSVRIGLVGSLFRDTSEPMIKVMLAPFKALMESQTGVRSELVVVKDLDGLSQQLDDGKLQLAVYHGFEFAWARSKHPELRPLLIAVNQQPFLRACLVVRNDSKAESAADLKGKKVAVHNRSREHSVLYLERRCVEPGKTPATFFGEVTTPRDSMDALDDVVDGNAQAAVVDAADLADFTKDKPGRAAKLRILQQSEPFPCAVVAYRLGKVEQADLNRFRDGMIKAKSTRNGQELMELCRITSFEAPPENYEQMLKDISQAYPPPAAPK
jgi:ABC-type phosphate/phosphonate transport system substrate-binding protein